MVVSKNHTAIFFSMPTSLKYTESIEKEVENMPNGVLYYSLGFFSFFLGVGDNLGRRNGNYILQISKNAKVVFNHTEFSSLYNCIKISLVFNSVFHSRLHFYAHTQHCPSQGAFQTFYTQSYLRNDF